MIMKWINTIINLFDPENYIPPVVLNIEEERELIKVLDTISYEGYDREILINLYNKLKCRHSEE